VLAIAASTAALPADDEIAVEELARMLEEGVPNDVVREWLAARPARVTPPDPDTMIRLRRAGADDALLQLIVERSAARPPATPPPAAASVPAADDVARLDVTVAYRPIEPLDGDDRAPSPDLVLYIDGRALARVPAQADLLGDPSEFRTVLPPGAHVLALAREFAEGREADRPGRFAPETLAITVDPGPRWELDLRWVDGMMSFGTPRPLTWELLRDGERMAGAEKIGTPTDRWPELCEDVEASLAPGEKPGRSMRRRLESCVRWVDLFDGIEDVPDRVDARHAARDGDRSGFESSAPFEE
jgi:hypothetical protein